MLIGDDYTTGDGLSLGVSLVLLEIPDEDWIKQVLISAFNTLTIEDNWNDKLGAITKDQATRVMSLMLQTLIFDYEPPPVTPVGAMMPWPGAAAPTGWILCQGQSLLRASYVDLFALIGTTYGAADSTHFNLPDMRDKSPMGAGGTVVTNPGDLNGELTHALVIGEIPSHDHDYAQVAHNHGVTDGGHAHVERTGSVQAHQALGGTGFTTFGTATSANSALQNTDSATTGITVNNASAGITFHAQGLNHPHNTVHPVIGLNYIIFTGI